MLDNPLYHPPAAPDFKRLQPAHASVIETILQENREAVDRLVAEGDFTWQGLMHPLEVMENRLSKALSPVGHLHHVTSTDEWRAAYENLLPHLSAYSSDMGQHEGLYRAIKAVKEGSEFATLSPAQQKTITDSLRAFERSGVGLPAADKERFKANSLRLAELSMQYANHVMDATNAWHLLLADDKRLGGVPESAKAVMADLARQHDQQGFRLTLDAPVVMPILTYAEDRALREQVYRAYNARASELADEGRFNNAELVAEILQLRHAQAQLLGFADYAAYSVDAKMAKESSAVQAFLQDLVQKGKAAGEADMAALREFAARELDLAELSPWDIAYASEKLRIAKYALSQEDLRPYFPMNKVLEGLFAISARLFGTTFRENHDLSVWHPDVRAWDVLDEAGQLQAQFYLDPYARAKKQGGAWMDGAATRMRDGEAVQLPVVYLVCNFTPPVGKAEACLTHDEVTTLFHEFGHGLHHMLTRIEVYSVSGLNGVEWDAVEQPSQFMENFCYDRESLALMTAHKDTGAPLPDALYDKLIKAKNFQSAMALLRQMEFALFDLQVHSAQTQGQAALDVHREVRGQVAVTPAFAENRFPMQFTHIFAGGYAAGYYSYKWAEVLSADSFAAFEEEGVFNPDTGKRFRDEILAVGGSRPSMESFIAFRRRKPQVDALLRHSGIAAAS